ncbi:MAG: hypothetical protein AB4372_30560 [Xenococcus sp. (in: cyanobacteria)]
MPSSVENLFNSLINIFTSNFHYLLLAGIIYIFITIDFSKKFDTSNAELTNADKNSIRWTIYKFIFTNLVVAFVLYYFSFQDPIKSILPTWLVNAPKTVRSLIFGLAYQTLIHQKLTTIISDKKEISFGVEAIYNNFKSLVERELNRIITVARIRTLSQERAKAQNTLDYLITRAKDTIQASTVLDDDDRERYSLWIDKIENETDTTNSQSVEKSKSTLLYFILFGRKT